MVEKLYFLRHGVAFERDVWHGENDELRPLTKEGIAAMRDEAKYLRKLKLKIDLLVTSPLVRAYDTAKPVAKALDIDFAVNDLLKPGCDIEALDALLAQYPQAQRVMVVGHQPDFSLIIATLTGGNVLMEKGGFARIDLADSNQLHGQLIWLLSPKLMGA
ncbi:MAG: phosphohistidine phosphatase SixA [Chloroflexota bacterium]